LHLALTDSRAAYCDNALGRGSVGEKLPPRFQHNNDMESYRIQQTGSGKIALDRKARVLDPVGTKTGYGLAPEEVEQQLKSL